ncbi:MAG TPA: tRNA (N6-isopentenyl adenosine(37)-C2)-methylthiotransferase MiaB [Candidatus Nealsonbacteria bacterium]|nr:tRNA (N6-isopentenyl adenosine(37)-C2)-methylthiotransferase MiaB [Candidatus Nealsonbacteria bacterium]HEB46754.1 tRNA (N6-isopentenyl adenosine(37)-C2)-methylthiotransferase MiaB [Candidatus Nealsonbacteria bacterium]
MKKYWIITFGCQMNHSDSERIATVLENIKYQPALNMNEADLILVNACSVRQSAIDRIWGQTKKFQKLKTKNSELRTVITGCVLKKDKGKFAKNFNLVLDINDLPELPEKLLTIKQFSNLTIKDSALQNESYLRIEPEHSDNFSAYVPIMTGCNNFCTFCVVPYTRGREISRPAKEIICEVQNLIKRGYKEIWLLGQNVNSYKFKGANFPKLLNMVNDIGGDFWIRFTSSHPKDFSAELINIMASCEKVTEYLNLPVQSGDDEILKKMNRPYTMEIYKNIIRKIRKKIPNITLSTDVIIGFPGEKEKAFENTVKLFKEIKYDMAYISQYSPRSGTKAANFKDDIPRLEKERRWKILTNILRKTALEKNKKYLGKTLDVLIETERPRTRSVGQAGSVRDRHGYLYGKTRNYKTIEFKGPKNLIGKFTKIKIVDAFPWRLKGEMI